MLELTLGISVVGLGLLPLFARFVLRQGAAPMRTISAARIAGGLVALGTFFAAPLAFASEKDLVLP
ncbi:MAG TPA: hypothetical protein VKJ47_11345, partial [Candidatus Binatia bacterium]|nr:hypothetical protein [Candidatus Binatia bacterium]